MRDFMPCKNCDEPEACEIVSRCLEEEGSGMHDDYKQLDLSEIVSAPPNGGPVLEPCPVCGSAGQLWQYSESETAPRKLLVMCSHGDRIGPQDGLTNEGCPFYMPPDAHYRETIRDAVRYWNELARAIVALRAGFTFCDDCTTRPVCQRQGKCIDGVKGLGDAQG